MGASQGEIGTPIPTRPEERPLLVQQAPRQEHVPIASAATVVKPDLVAAAGLDARAIPIGPGVTRATNHSNPVVRSAEAIEASLRHDRPPDDTTSRPSEERPLLVQLEPRQELAPIAPAATVAPDAHAVGHHARAPPIGPGMTHTISNSDPAVRSAEAIEASSRQARPPDAPSAPPADSTPSAASRNSHLHLGSRRPHEADGDKDMVLDAPAHAGSFRILEAELFGVLSVEPLPTTNLSFTTEPEPLPRLACASNTPLPGPFTDEQLLPAGVFETVVKFGQRVQLCVERALQPGEYAWKHARDLRPASRVFTEEEALMPAARGFRWRRGADGLWHVLQPSIWPFSPPNTDINTEAFLSWAHKTMLPDKQLISWMLHGMPGAPHMPVFGQLAPPHVGALKNARKWIDIHAKDMAAGFVTGGHAFPDVWPCIIDPTNIVVQNGKGRMTIDKSMLISGDPDLPSFNLTIDLDRDDEGRRYLLIRIWQFARGCAILATACAGLTGIQPKISKFDLRAFFRMHGIQAAAAHQNGRLAHDGYGTDWRLQFGASNSPDHAGRASNSLVHFTRHELARLDEEYAPRHPQLLAWLEHRRNSAPPNSAMIFVASLWMLVFYVDDGGLCVIDDPLYDRRGEPIIDLVTQADGSIVRRHQTRATMYFEASTGVAGYIGYGTPEDKRVYPCRELTLIGIGIDLDRAIRYLDHDKATRYATHVRDALASPRLPNGCLSHQEASFVRLVHRLLHASEVVPWGRPHLFYMLRALRMATRLSKPLVIIDRAAESELAWWTAVLDAPDDDLAKDLAVPLASRSRFPTVDESPGTLVHYGDASREYDETTGVMATSSGFGAWTILDDIFFYIEGRWEPHECAAFSINLLEAHVQLMGAVTFVTEATARAIPTTHVHTFIDNQVAEFVSERGRTQAEGLHVTRLRRVAWLQARGLFLLTSRVASIHNDVADLLSRGDVEAALRMARDSGARDVVRLHVPSETRDLSQVPPTWA